MSGYWSLFYEDQNTWSQALSDVCSTIVNYGVEIPWCVCHTSSSLIQVVSESMAVFFLSLSAVTGADEWWTIEWTVASMLITLELPIIIKRAHRNWLALVSQVCFLITGLCWMGCFLEVAAGIQGGVVFGGRLFYPALFLLGIALGGVVHTLNLINAEIYGFGPFEADNKDARVMKPLRAFCKLLSYEALMMFSLATFGLPKIEAETSPLPWLCLFPLISIGKEASEYLTEPEASNVHSQTNGSVSKDKSETDSSPHESTEKDVVAKTAADTVKKMADATVKATETKSKENPTKKTTDSSNAKIDETKGPEKGSTDTTAIIEANDESPVPKVSVISKMLAAFYSGCHVVCSGLMCLMGRIRSLPWECITTIILGLGTHITSAYIFWTLTNDIVAWILPMVLILTPLSLAKFGANIAKNKRTLVMDMTTCGVAVGQYYLYKSNIIQAY
ncbi:hypothetical protein TCAL_14682 [Tigriopus californicus]|uniref:Transmembrane protein n=1 Tax=Tigriopus californicus TaxID=6832 RepID=A0A553NQB5_TIGCA|nr:uncharacterized protein LOC131879893 [Tigriopus californicus]TRY67633.1 hypothetical protein TCAL_14682 [Tigriopus californicus]